MSKLIIVCAFVLGLAAVQPYSAAQSAEEASPPNTPVIGPCSGSTVNYRQDDFTQTPAPSPSCAEQLPALQGEAQAATISTTQAPAQEVEQVLTAVETRKPGNYVADGRKMTLYTLVATGEGKLRFGPPSNEGVQRQARPCTGQCLDTWLPLTVEDASVLASEGLDRALDPTLIGSTRLDDGTLQVTYNGFPLFYFSGDTASGQKKGLGMEGFGGRWYMVSSSNGALLEANLASR
jgi:predicted lipoprotein with Yx(FWY)xxD motif